MNNVNNDNGSAIGFGGGHRFGGSLEAIAEGLMAVLVLVVAAGAFVHEWHPAAGAPADGIAQHQQAQRAPRG